MRNASCGLITGSAAAEEIVYVTVSYGTIRVTLAIATALSVLVELTLIAPVYFVEEGSWCRPVSRM